MRRGGRGGVLLFAFALVAAAGCEPVSAPVAVRSADAPPPKEVVAVKRDEARSDGRSRDEAPPPPRVAVSDALGLRFTEARGFFLAGPRQVVIEGGVVLWQYQSESCVLEAAFWRDDQGDGIEKARLRNLSARDRVDGRDLESAEPCLNDVRAANQLNQRRN